MTPTFKQLTKDYETNQLKVKHHDLHNGWVLQHKKDKITGGSTYKSFYKPGKLFTVYLPWLDKSKQTPAIQYKQSLKCSNTVEKEKPETCLYPKKNYIHT